MTKTDTFLFFLQNIYHKSLLQTILFQRCRFFQDHTTISDFCKYVIVRGHYRKQERVQKIVNNLPIFSLKKLICSATLPLNSPTVESKSTFSMRERWKSFNIIEVPKCKYIITYFFERSKPKTLFQPVFNNEKWRIMMRSSKKLAKFHKISKIKLSPTELSPHQFFVYFYFDNNFNFSLLVSLLLKVESIDLINSKKQYPKIFDSNWVSYFFHQVRY